MSPEEKVLLERTLKLSEENNKILHRLDRTRRLAVVWGLIKVAIIIVPLILGYIFLQPYIQEAMANYSGAVEFLNNF